MLVNRLPRRLLWPCLPGALMLSLVFAGVAQADTVTFSNPNPIAIPSTGASPVKASPYPSQMSFSGVNGNITKLQLDLQNLAHTYPDDIDILLEGPTGQKAIVMSDAGGSLDINVDLLFDDAAPNLLPNSTQITSGTFKPTDFPPADTFPAPAPGPPYATNFTGFNGTDANGTWRLYVVDDVAPVDGGTIAGGWSLKITTPAASPNAQPGPVSPGGTRVLAKGTCANPQRGTNRRDVMIGTSAGDRLSGRGGNDRLSGRGGRDCLSGGSGNDRLNGGSGRNSLSGGSGNDRINSRNRRFDVVRCGSGRDKVRADRFDTLIGC